VIGVPACAAALFIAVVCFFTHVIDEQSLGFPLNFTLPLIFCSLLPVASVLIATPERGLLAIQESFAYALVWQRPLNLAVAFIGQVTALSLFAVLSRRRV
jgi:Na+/citrate or Na+/malate symporter